MTHLAYLDAGSGSLIVQAVVGGVACVVLLWLLVRAQRTFWDYDAENPTP